MQKKKTKKNMYPELEKKFCKKEKNNNNFFTSQSFHKLIPKITRLTSKDSFWHFLAMSWFK